MCQLIIMRIIEMKLLLNQDENWKELIRCRIATKKVSNQQLSISDFINKSSISYSWTSNHKLQQFGRLEKQSYLDWNIFKKKVMFLPLRGCNQKSQEVKTQLPYIMPSCKLPPAHKYIFSIQSITFHILISYDRWLKACIQTSLVYLCYLWS